MSTTPTPEPPRIKSLDEREFDLKAAQFRREQDSIPWFASLPKDHQLNQIMAFCQGITGSRFICEEARNDTPSIFFLTNLAHDLGLKWTSIKNMFMSPGGKIGMETSIVMALLLSKGFKVKYLKNTPEEVECWIKRPGGPDEFEMSIAYTYEQALEFGWPTGKSGVKPPWKDRANMLRLRTLYACGRLVAADLLGGIYHPDELEDFDPPTSAVPYSREAEADRKAEVDPGLKLEPKALDAAPAANIIEIPTKTSTRQPEPVLTHAEAKTEAFLKRHEAPPARAERKATAREPVTQEARKPSPVPPTPANLGDLADANAAKLGLTEEDIPRENAPEPVDPKQGMAVRIKAFCAKFGGAPLTVTRFSKAFFGNPEDMSDMAKLGEALDLLENALLLRTDAIPIYLENPEQMGQNLRIMANDIAKEEALAKAAEPVARSQPKSTPPPPPPPPPVDPVGAQNPLDDILPQAWSGETCDLAWSIMKKLRMPQDKLMTSLKSFGILEYSDNDAAAFFQMYYHSPDSTLLMKRATERGLPASRVLDEFVEGMFLHAPLTHQTNPNAAIQAIMNAMTEIQSMEVAK